MTPVRVQRKPGLTHQAIVERIHWRIENIRFKREWIEQDRESRDPSGILWWRLDGQIEGLMRAWEEASYLYFGERDDY